MNSTIKKCLVTITIVLNLNTLLAKDVLVFTSTTNGSDYYLTTYDGTTTSMKSVKTPTMNMMGDIRALDPYFIAYDGKLYFKGSDSKLWVYNYETDTASLVASASTITSPSFLTVYKNKLYFNANDGTNGTELRSYDSQTDSVSLVQDIRSGANGSNPANFTIYNDKLYFAADDGTNGYELWSYDGTSASMAADIHPTNSSSPNNFTVYNNKLYFSATDGTNGTELWSYDGSSASMVADIESGANSSGISNLAVYDGKLYFSALSNADGGTELRVYDGITVSLVKDIYPGSSSSSPSFLTVYDNKLYFKAVDGTYGYELFSYDSKTDTVSTEDIVSGTDHSSPAYLSIYNNKLYFRATDGINGKELWSYDGTNASMVKDIYIEGNGSPSYLYMATLSSNESPTISNTVASQAIDENETVKLFSTATFADTEDENISLTITLDDNAKGVLSGTGLSGTGPYTVASTTTSSLKTIVQNIIFTPSKNRVAIGSKETTTFSLVANDGNSDSLTNTTTTVVSTSIDDAPELDTIANHTNIENSGTTTVTLNASDEEGDTIGYTVASLDTTKATVNIIDGKVVVTPLKNATGSVTIAVNAVSNGKVTTKTFTVELIDAPTAKPTGLTADKWNMISIPKGKLLDTTTIDTSFITSGKAVKVFRSGVWVENPTDVNAKEAIWIHPTSTSVDINPTDDTSNDFANKEAQFAYYKTLSTGAWHFVGVQYTMQWSDLTKAVITPDSCEGYTFIKYYDSANDSWNTTANIPVGSGVWLRHLCK